MRLGTPDEVGLLREPLVRMRSILASRLPPGAVLLVARDGVIVEHSAVGVVATHGVDGALLPSPVPTRTDTIYDLASISKLYVAVVAMQLVESGSLALDVPVADYLPSFVVGRRATVRQLLSHSAGLPSGHKLQPYPSVESRLATIYEVPAEAEPGTAYKYSDLSAIVAAKVVEAVSGSSLDALVRKEICEPFGLVDTLYNPPASLLPRIAPTEFQPDRGLIWGSVHDSTAWLLGGVAGSAGVFATAYDLAVFTQALLSGGPPLLSEASVKEMLTDANAGIGPRSQRGLGFDLERESFMGDMARPGVWGHTGFTGTSVVADPASQAFVIVLSNRVHPTRETPRSNPVRADVASELARALR
ncbi:serine hydrolase domain-containing protein [Tenggerimyces flavus]|uniref:Serine hydrolase domain-containing protein n=1 Tax=Tenggerimyces flavus TaxID=1708749 RepID=A0ABV7YCU8_9ACTN|nr:serine hydrolase domain-containing protein [Tenggerimyces flavus]MBM7787994.1 CubicO group peptidase (beta-lactamase class C family) [Tenggerimyces flavus]